MLDSAKCEAEELSTVTVSGGLASPPPPPMGAGAAAAGGAACASLSCPPLLATACCEAVAGLPAAVMPLLEIVLLTLLRLPVRYSCSKPIKAARRASFNVLGSKRGPLVLRPEQEAGRRATFI
jgi:hypothetical protein